MRSAGLLSIFSDCSISASARATSSRGGTVLQLIGECRLQEFTRTGQICFCRKLLVPDGRRMTAALGGGVDVVATSEVFLYLRRNCVDGVTFAVSPSAERSFCFKEESAHRRRRCSYQLTAC